MRRRCRSGITPVSRCIAEADEEKQRDYTTRVPMVQERGLTAAVRTASEVTVIVTYTVVGCAVIGGCVGAK
jgi:hypothetical protein